MRFTIVYLVLVSFTFLSLTPAGVSLAELRADDGFELDELDLGLELEEDEEEESGKGSEDEEEPSADEEESEVEEEAPAPKRQSKSSGSEDYVSTSKKIMAVYMFEDSHTAKSASHVTAATASHLAGSKDYDYVGTETFLFASPSSWLKNAKRDFEEGKALYNDLGIEEAIEKFKSALKTVENNIDKVGDMTFLSEVLFYLGASYQLIEDDDMTEFYFSIYISINPDSRPSDPAFSDEVMSAFDDVKSNRRDAGQGSVRVQCNEDGALVFIDGRIAGMTPVILRGINDGKHYYRIHKNGFRDAGGSVAVREGKTVSIEESLRKNTSASDIADLEDAMRSGFGGVTMIRKATDIAQDNGLDNVFIVKASLGSDEKLKYQGYMIDCNKKEYKKSEAVFSLPEKGEADRSAALKEFNKALVDDPYEYKAISDLIMEEAEMLGLSEKAPAAEEKEDKEKKPIYKEWWLWTVVGVVVLAGVGVGTYFAVTSGKDGSSGATLDVNFQ
jgi:tetratricopeptide (TPR) repeat protein